MIARKSTLILLGNATDALLAYVALFFISRYMGPNEYGIIGFAMSFVGLFSFLGSLGFNQAHVKKMSEGKDPGVRIGSFMTIKLILTVIMSIATIGAVVFWKYVLNRGFESSTHETAIFIILFYYIFEKISDIFLQTFIADTYIAKKIIPHFIDTIIRTSAIIYVALAGYGAIALALSYVLGHFFLFLVSLLFFRGYPIKKPTKLCIKEYNEFAWPCLIVTVASMFISNFDKVLIQLFWSSTEVGYYFASFRVSGLIVLIGSSVGMVMFPTISNYFIKNKEEDIKNILSLSERYISLYTIPCVIGVIALAKPAIPILLSNSFIPAYYIWCILPVYSILYALFIPCESYFLGVGKPYTARNRMLVMVTINILLNILLVPKSLFGVRLFGLGAVGSAIALVLSYGSALIFYKVMIWRCLKITMNKRIILHLFAGVIMGAVLYYLSTIVLIERFYHLLIFGLAGLGIYFGILYLLKEFTCNDLNVLIETLNVKKMYNYIKDEIKK